MTADERLRWYARFFGLTYVAVDCHWQPFIPAATTDWAVLSFHGRNAAGWEAQMRGKQPSVAEKYDYLYSPDELTGLAETVQRFHGRVCWSETRSPSASSSVRHLPIPRR